MMVGIGLMGLTRGRRVKTETFDVVL